MSSRSKDPWSRSEYRRLIAWDSRIERERPFLIEVLESAPDRSVLDIGCGTGEHTAFFAGLGARAVGIDRSEGMIERAKDYETRQRGRFVLGEAAHACAVLAGEPPFGLILSLGNMLPYILESAELEGILGEIHALLQPGGLLLIQILNYRRIVDHGIRHLPLNFRPHDGSETEIVFLRILKPLDDKRILFFPTTLVLDPTKDDPVELKVTRRVELRPWMREDLCPVLERQGFTVKLYGDMEGGEFLPDESSDLVLLGTRYL